MTLTKTAPEQGQDTGTRTYNAAQQAARDYMQAQKVLDDLAAQAKPHKAMQKAALDTLTIEYGASKTRDVEVNVTGCWNVPLTFLHRTDTTTAWAKVVEALRPHLTAAQQDILDAIVEDKHGTRLTRKVTA